MQDIFLIGTAFVYSTKSIFIKKTKHYFTEVSFFLHVKIYDTDIE